ncbi:2TM domain-containing protein [Pontimicrobium sp. IMCC45349]|uniref:2TM domain-containing protein n=1 Tax=Pontimicrobium sp. IMCC45349 TaxID=3391574 RepID=UPI0039A2A8C1
MNDLDKEQAYLSAKRRVDKLRGFYSHLTVYIGANLLVSGYKIIRNIRRGESLEEAIFDLSFSGMWMLWGLGLIIHAFVVFILPKIVGENWEERKIKQFMEEEEKNKFN